MPTVEQYSQYGKPCVWPEPGDTAHDLMAKCREVGAIYHEDGPDDECFVVALRPTIGAELWTEAALTRGMQGKNYAEHRQWMERDRP